MVLPPTVLCSADAAATHRVVQRVLVTWWYCISDTELVPRASIRNHCIYLRIQFQNTDYFMKVEVETRLVPRLSWLRLVSSFGKLQTSRCLQHL
jgi:hypothetical protein